MSMSIYEIKQDGGDVIITKNNKTLNKLELHLELDALEARNAELLEAVKKAHEILLHEMDNGRTPSMLQGVGLGYFEDVICGVKS